VPLKSQETRFEKRGMNERTGNGSDELQDA